jgi:sacsin
LGIRKLHDSVKVKDPLKVGRFGLGFKSVFHMTGQRNNSTLILFK